MCSGVKDGENAVTGYGGHVERSGNGRASRIECKVDRGGGKLGKGRSKKNWVYVIRENMKECRVNGEEMVVDGDDVWREKNKSSLPNLRVIKAVMMKKVGSVDRNAK